MYNITIYNNIKALCDTKKISLTALTKALGIGENTFTKLKKGELKSLSTKNLTLIAEYFNVSLDYITGNSDIKEKSPSTEELSPKKKQVMDLLDSMTDDQMDLFISIMKETIKNRAEE